MKAVGLRCTPTLVMMYCLLISLPGLAQKENEFIRKGNELYKGKKYGEAAGAYQKALEKNAASQEANFNLGDALYENGKYEEAGNYFRKYTAEVKDKNKLAAAYHNLGNSFLRDKKYEECIDAYKKALKLNPSDNDTRYNLAYAKTMLNKQQQQKNEQKQNDNNQQNKDQQNKDKQNEGDKKKDEKNDKNDQKQNGGKEENKSSKPDEQQAQKQQMKKEDADRILNALRNEEKDLHDKLRKKAVVGKKVKIDKDW